MGIDIGFVSDDLKRCPKANCREYRNTLVGFVEPEKGHEPWRGLRAYRLDASVVRRDAPDYYRPTQQLDREHFALIGHMERVPAGSLPEGEAGELLKELTSRSQHFRYSLVPQRVMGEEEFQSKVAKVIMHPDAHQGPIYTAWEEVLSPEERLRICRACPLRPLGEDNCYARFSNYPGMASFRLGLMAAIAAMASIDQEMGDDQQVKDPFAWWTFRRLLERAGHDSLTDLHGSLLAYFGEETHEHMLRAEHFFDQVVDLLDHAVGEVEGMEASQSPKLSQGIRHHEADTLLAGLIYRDDPYQPEQMEYLLPRLYAYQAAAEWALWETGGNKRILGLLLGFLERWRTLTGMLRTGWLVGLRVFVSY